MPRVEDCEGNDGERRYCGHGEFRHRLDAPGAAFCRHVADLAHPVDLVDLADLADLEDLEDLADLADLPDPPETMAATAGQTSPPTRAGGQDDGG